MESYQQFFALTKNPKYVKMRLPKNGRPSKLNNTANAGRIVRGRNGRKILPAFLLTIFVAALAIAAIPQEKKTRRSRFGADQEKEVLQKAVEMARHDSHQGRGKLPPRMPQSECGAGHTGYRTFLIRRRADHRTPAEPSAAEFSGLVSTTAPSEQGIFAPCGSVLTWHK